MIGTFFLLIFIMMVSFILWLHRKELLRQEGLLALQVQQRNGRMKTGILGYPKLVFNYRGLEVRVFSTTAGSYTHATASFMLPENVKLSIVKRSAITFFSGRRGWQTGNTVFDETFLIKGHNGTFLRNFLNSTIQQQLLTFRMDIDCTVDIRQDEFEFKLSRIPKTVEEYDHFIDMALACIDQLYVLYGTDDDEDQRLGMALHPEKHAPILSCLLAGLLLNPCIAVIYNKLLAPQLLPDHDVFPFLAIILKFPLFSALFSFALSVLGVYGIWKWKEWGWIVVMILSTLYLGFYGGILISMKQFGLLEHSWRPGLVSIYMSLFSLVLMFYLWRQSKYYK